MALVDDIEGPNPSQPYASYGGETDNIIPIQNPLNEGIFMPGFAEQQAAYDNMPAYEVEVVKRKSLSRPELTPRATYYEELVTFSDGARRTLTHAMPNERYFGAKGVSPFSVSGTDALGTGPTGLNRDIVEGLAESGYDVLWLHHQGRHSELPLSAASAQRMARFLFRKSVGRSAAHQHALLDDYARHAAFDTTQIFSVGDSRGAMTGEAVDARAPQHDRKVVYSDYIDPCFAARPNLKDLGPLALSGITEPLGLGVVGMQLLHKAVYGGEIKELVDYLGTFDMHPLNVLHEIAWMRPLTNGDAGKYARAVPLDSVGVRTFMEHSLWSRVVAWRAIHANRPGIKFMYAPGTHVNLANQEVQQARQDRFDRLIQELRDHDFALPGVNFDYVISGKSELATAA